MKFFHKHLRLFYIIPFCMGIAGYMIGYFLKAGVLLIISLVLFLISLAFFAYENWRKAISIYFNFIFISSKEKYEIKARIIQDANFAEEYELERSYKKRIYLKSFITAMLLGLASTGIFVILVLNLVGWL